MTEIENAVLPVFDELGLKYHRDGNAVMLGFTGDLGHYRLLVGKLESSPIGPFLVLRYETGLYIADGHERQKPLDEAALAYNYFTAPVRCGRDPRDGQVAFTAEIPLLGGGLSLSQFGRLFAAIHSQVQQGLELLYRVQWGNVTVFQALGLEDARCAEREEAAQPRSQAEQQALEVIKTLLEQETDGEE